MQLNDEQWDVIRKHFPEENPIQGKPGPKPTPAREILEAVLWILNTGAQWAELPQRYPPYQTVHRRFQAWCRDDTLCDILCDLAPINCAIAASLTSVKALSMRCSAQPKVAVMGSEKLNGGKVLRSWQSLIVKDFRLL